MAPPLLQCNVQQQVQPHILLLRFLLISLLLLLLLLLHVLLFSSCSCHEATSLSAPLQSAAASSCSRCKRVSLLRATESCSLLTSPTSTRLVSELHANVARLSGTSLPGVSEQSVKQLSAGSAEGAFSATSTRSKMFSKSPNAAAVLVVPTWTQRHLVQARIPGACSAAAMAAGESVRRRMLEPTLDDH
jgi:hypothetical protein